MHIIVCIKSVVVAAPKGKIVRTADTCALNPFDRPALEIAMQLKAAHGGSVTALSMGPPSAEACLREAMAAGADRAVLLCDHFGANSLILVGFNWDEEDQEYLKTVGQTKLNKLTWGSMIMTQLPRAELVFFEDVVRQFRGEEPTPESTVEEILRNIRDYALDMPPGGQGS